MLSNIDIRPHQLEDPRIQVDQLRRSAFHSGIASHILVLIQNMQYVLVLLDTLQGMSTYQVMFCAWPKLELTELFRATFVFITTNKQHAPTQLYSRSERG